MTVAEELLFPPGPLQLMSKATAPEEVGVIDCAPLAFCVPVQAPLATHEVAFVDDQTRSALPPSGIALGIIEIDTVGAGSTVMVAVLDLVVSCVEVAVTVAVPAAAEVKTPALLMLPMLDGLTE